MKKNVLDWIFLILTFLSFTATTYSPPWNSSSMEFFAFLSVVFISFTVKIKLIEVANKNVILFFIFFIIACLIVSLNSENFSKENFSLAILYSLASIIFTICFSSRQKEILDNYLSCILAAGLFSALIIFSQKFDTESHLGIWRADYDQAHGRPYANFGQPNLAATLLLTSLCCALYLNKKEKISTKYLLPVVLIISTALSLASSKTAFLAIFILLIFSISFKDKISFLVFSIASICIAISKALFTTRQITSSDISTGRFDLWLTMIDAVAKHIFTGYGVLNTKIAHFEVRELHPTSQATLIGSGHNIFLDFLIWFGIPLGIFISFLFIKTLLVFIKNNTHNHHVLFAIVPITLHSFLEYPLFYSNFLMLFVALLSIGASKAQSTPYIRTSLMIMSAYYLLFSITTIEYHEFSEKYRSLRFFDRGFAYTQVPEKINPLILNNTINQFNILRLKEISDTESIKEIFHTTKIQPSAKNFCLILNYLSKSKNTDDLIYWQTKAKASLENKDFNYAIRCQIKLQ